MAEAFIYDHVRTPRGRGKQDGSLHEVTALNLAAQALGAIKSRNELDPAQVDDVVLGCVDPVGEAGGNIARSAAIVDRKSTRLNSSHLGISYAVFCLKKKKKK